MAQRVQPKFDRKGQVAKTGKGALDFYILLDNRVKKYIKYTTCTPDEVEGIMSSDDFKSTLGHYQHVVNQMLKSNVPLTLENFNKRIGAKIVERKEPANVRYKTFTDFIRDLLANEKIKDSTKRHKYVTFDSVIIFGKLDQWEDVNDVNLREFDKWLHEDGMRSDVTVYNYHKHLKKWCRLAYEERLLPENPYTRLHFARGKSNERQPLSEEQLVEIRNLDLFGHLERARDLFIFSAYTGLAYADVMSFNFKTMTKKMNERYFIDGTRTKTGSNFFTPILQPAMDMLEKYDYKLPTLSNQKLNDYLKVVASAANIRSKVSYHVARHSFATMCLSHEIPIENVSRMLGHQDIKTTQIYAKILPSTIQKQTEALAASIL